MCVFCKIVANEIPSYKVYEDDDYLAFLDIAPVNPGHTLVIPKKHFVNIEDIDEDTLMGLMRVVKKMGKLVKDNLGYEGYNVYENNDPVAGQVVPHIHFHIIPRKSDDGLGLWPQKSYSEGEAGDILKQMLNNKN